MERRDREEEDERRRSSPAAAATTTAMDGCDAVSGRRDYDDDAAADDGPARSASPHHALPTLSPAAATGTVG